MFHTPIPPLILASSSPYRREQLARLRMHFEAIAPDIDETAFSGEPAEELALRLAKDKAMAVARQHPGAVVIGSDQVALCGNRVLGKPGTLERAHEQLRLMAGRQTEFHTALAVTDGNRLESASILTRCAMRPLTD